MGARVLHVVCPACDQVNRVADTGRLAQAVCGRCGSGLFAGRAVAVDGAQFRKHVERCDLPVLVDFWAPWCGPCRTMGPIFERAAEDLEPRARFLKVNVDENPDIATDYGIRGIPALLAFSGGTVAAQQAGVVEGSLLRAWVDRLSPA
jgi:thioredoxin 2